MNISKGHSGLLKIFLLNLVKFHLVLGFQQSPFQISLEFKHDGMMNKQVKQGLNWGCDNVTESGNSDPPPGGGAVATTL